MFPTLDKLVPFYLLKHQVPVIVTKFMYGSHSYFFSVLYIVFYSIHDVLPFILTDFFSFLFLNLLKENYIWLTFPCRGGGKLVVPYFKFIGHYFTLFTFSHIKYLHNFYIIAYNSLGYSWL